MTDVVIVLSPRRITECVEALETLEKRLLVGVEPASVDLEEWVFA